MGSDLNVLGQMLMDDDVGTAQRADAALLILLRTAFQTGGAVGVYQVIVALQIPRAEKVSVPHVDTGNLFARMFHDLVEKCWHMRCKSNSVNVALSLMEETRDMYSIDDLTELNVVETVSRSFPMPKYGGDDVKQLQACVQSVALARKAGFIGRQLAECVGLLLALEHERTAWIAFMKAATPNARTPLA